MARENKSKLMNQRHGKFIAPGMLAKGRGSGMKTFQSVKKCQNFHFANQGAPSKGFESHTLIMNYDGEEYLEKDFKHESSLLDILTICKKFLDIYSVGFQLTNGDGNPLRNDQDMVYMMDQHEGVQNIHVYLDKDEASPPLSFKLPQDNSILGVPISQNQNVANVQRLQSPKVTNVKILGDVRVKEKVIVAGAVVGGTEGASVVQLFITMSRNFDIENDLQSISLSQTEKVFSIPLEAVGHYLVAKYTPMTEDGKCGQPMYAISDNFVENSSPKNVRGKNKNKKVGALHLGEKLEIKFLNNRPVGTNQPCWSRHLGILARDTNLCPVRVQTWNDIKIEVKNHLWDLVKECFHNPDIELYREHTLEHMRSLWSNWRSCLYKKNVEPCQTVAEMLKNVPLEMSASDWEWLVKNKFLTEKYQKYSKRNTVNRVTTLMPHRTGSKPHNQIMHEMGVKDGTPPDLGELFLKTRQKNGNFVEKESSNKYDEIVNTVQSDPSLSNLEIIDKCFGKQTHSHVFCYGGGMKRKNLKESDSTYVKELQAQLQEQQDENRHLKRRLDGLESRLEKMENVSGQPSIVESPTTNIDHREDA